METTNPTVEKASASVREFQSRAEDTMQQAGRRWNDTLQVVSGRARDAMRYTEQRVQQNPWTALGIGFGAGLVMGALIVLAAVQQRR